MIKTIKRILYLVSLILLIPFVNACNQSNQPLRVVFIHRGDTDFEIYTVEVNGQNLELVTSISTNYLDASFSNLTMELSPTAKHLARFASSGLNIVDLTTGESVLVSENARSVGPFPDILKWSPDGKQLAFTGSASDEVYPYDIYVYNMDTRQVSNLTENELLPDQIGFAWAPDGEHLAFSTYEAGGLGHYAISNVATGSLVWYSDIDVPDDARFHRACHGAWSPDGVHFAFVIGCSLSPTLGPEWFETYVFDLEEGELIPATGLMEEAHIGSVRAKMQPFWYPDGKTLVVAYTYGTPAPWQDADSLGIKPVTEEQGLIVFDLGESRQITNVQLPDSSMPLYRQIAMSSNGQLVWQSQDGWYFATLEESQLQIASADFEISPGCSPILWSPKGDTFAYTGTDDVANCSELDANTIYVVDPEAKTSTDVSATIGGYNWLLGWLQE
jgi:Tol biopolymer transport system component